MNKLDLNCLDMAYGCVVCGFCASEVSLSRCERRSVKSHALNKCHKRSGLIGLVLDLDVHEYLTSKFCFIIPIVLDHAVSQISWLLR